MEEQTATIEAPPAETPAVEVSAPEVTETPSEPSGYDAVDSDKLFGLEPDEESPDVPPVAEPPVPRQDAELETQDEPPVVDVPASDEAIETDETQLTTPLSNSTTSCIGDDKESKVPLSRGVRSPQESLFGTV